MGIEPTSRAVNARLNGFEDRGHHQVCRHFPPIFAEFSGCRDFGEFLRRNGTSIQPDRGYCTMLALPEKSCLTVITGRADRRMGRPGGAGGWMR
jgi:hypothetical protein